MKKISMLLLTALLLLACQPALAQTSLLQTETRFAATFDGLNAEIAHTLTLAQGDVLNISLVQKSGEMTLRIDGPADNILFTASSSTTPGQTLPILEGGDYRVTLIGLHASGTAWVGLQSDGDNIPPESSDIPYRRERIISALGFSIENDPDAFDYVSGEGIEAFILHDEGITLRTDVMLSITRIASPVDAVAGEFLAQGSFTEAEPGVIDGRPTRRLHFTRTMEDGYLMQQDCTLVRIGADDTLCFIATYHGGEAGASEKMENMVQGVLFTY